MPSATAMDSYAALGSDELWNRARLRAYVDNGIIPPGYSIRCGGCEGLEGILPCTGSEPPAGGYCLPEKDTAPWYDPAVPESRDFAGLMVMDVNINGAFARSVTPNVGDGATLGRLRNQGRTIVVRGWLIGKTCCATAYGLRWLTSALGDPGCGGRGCGGEDLDYLACCPNVDPDTDCVSGDCGPRDNTGLTEYQRAQDYWRRMHGVGVIDGPNVLTCKGNSCGCSCGSLLEVEFTLAASSPYANSLERLVVDGALIGGDCSSSDCGITWCLGETDCTECGACPEGVACTDDPYCVTPTLPPMPIVASAGCGCIPQQTASVAFPIASVREWGTSTLNIALYAGSKPLRNTRIDIIQNPTGRPCGDFNQDCESCSSIEVAYVPAYGTLTISGEERKVTVECSNITQNALGSVANSTGNGFDWPDLSCQDMCVRVRTDCDNTAADATITVGIVTREL